MNNLLLTLLHLVVMTAKLCGPGGVRAVIAENLVLKQQLIVLRRGLTTNSRPTRCIPFLIDDRKRPTPFERGGVTCAGFD